MSKDSDDIQPPKWTRGFRVGTKQGMTCDICHCLVREKPGDAKAHLAWHDKLEQRSR